MVMRPCNSSPSMAPNAESIFFRTSRVISPSSIRTIIVTCGNPALPTWRGPLLFDVVYKAAAEAEKYSRRIASSVDDVLA